MADAKGAYIGGVPVQFKDAAARAMISDEYNSAETYAKGNLCIYNGKIYEAIKETTGTWDATAWEETTLAEVNAKMRSDITNLTEKSNSLHFPLTKLSTVDGVNIYYARYGKIVEIIAIGNFSKAETIESGKGLTIGVLPVGFRPADVRFFGLGFLYANSSCLTLAIDKTGTITVTSTSATINISSGKYFNFCKHFMIP